MVGGADIPEIRMKAAYSGKVLIGTNKVHVFCRIGFLDVLQRPSLRQG